MQAWLQQLLDAHGYIAITLVTLLVNAFPPLPAESTLPVIAGILASFDSAFAPAIAAATLGLVLGTLPFYLLGRLPDERRCMRFLDRPGHWMALSSSDTENPAAGSGALARRWCCLGV